MTQEFPQLSADERDVLERVITGVRDHGARRAGKPLQPLYRSVIAQSIANATGIALGNVYTALARLLELNLICRERDYYKFSGGNVSVAFENIVAQEV